MTRKLIEQMLATLEAANAIIYEDFCGTTCPELQTCDEAILAARAYLAAPGQSEVEGLLERTSKAVALYGPQSEDEEVGFRDGFMIAARASMHPAPQPTSPGPVNQMLIGQLKEFARVFPELNMSNFTDDDVADLNGWGIEVVTAIDAAEQAPQPTELSGQDVTRYAVCLEFMRWQINKDRVATPEEVIGFIDTLIGMNRRVRS